MKQVIIITFLFAIFTISIQAAPIRVMLLDGESGGPYHKWQLTTPLLKKQLEETGLFQVDVVTAPDAKGDASSFKPEMPILFGGVDIKQLVLFQILRGLDGVWPLHQFRGANGCQQ